MVTFLTLLNVKGFALAQCVALSFAMFYLVKSRRSTGKTIILLIATIILTFALLQLKIEMPSYIKLLIVNLTIIGIWCLIFNKYIGETIFYAVIVFYELMLCDLLAGNMMALLMKSSVGQIIYNEQQELHTQLVYMLFGITSLAVFCLCLYFTIKYFKSKTLSIVNKYWISIDVILFFCYLISLLFMNINAQVLTKGMTVGALLVWSGFATVAILIIKLFANLCYFFQTENNRMMIEIKNKALEEQLNLQTTSINEMRVFRHDISNHLRNISYLIEKNSYTEARAYLTDMTTKIAKQKCITYCANDTINAVLNLIRMKCDESNIALSIYIESDYNTCVSSTDITAILFNLLNNSVEAVAESKILKKKSIQVQIGTYHAYDCFIVKNPYDKVVQSSNGTFVTTKSDTVLHGYGLKSIQETTIKYNGNLHIDISNNIFKATVLLLTK